MLQLGSEFGNPFQKERPQLRTGWLSHVLAVFGVRNPFQKRAGPAPNRVVKSRFGGSEFGSPFQKERPQLEPGG